MSDDLFDLDSSEAEEFDTYEGKYGLFVEDEMAVDTLIRAVRVILTREDVTPHQISQLAAFLFALKRLPLVTEGICLGIRLVYEFNEDRIWRQIRIDDSSLNLESGGYAFSPGVGGDSYSGSILEAYAGGGRDGDALQASEFATLFLESAADSSYHLEIDDDLGTAFDQWDQEADQDAWSNLESGY